MKTFKQFISEEKNFDHHYQLMQGMMADLAKAIKVQRHHLQMQRQVTARNEGTGWMIRVRFKHKDHDLQDLAIKMLVKLLNRNLEAAGVKHFMHGPEFSRYTKPENNDNALLWVDLPDHLGRMP